MKKFKLFYECDLHFLMKTFRIMRIVLFLLLISILQTFANDVYSQKTKLSIDFSDTKLEDVLDEIEDLTEFNFLYNEKLIDTDRMVTLSVKNQKVEDILDKLFVGADVVYTITDRKIILTPSSLFNIKQQEQSVTGKVTDSNGQSLPGATIAIKGTTLGVITDVDGNYTLNNIPENSTLQFSFVGMKTQEIEIENQTVINVTLLEETIGLEEVVAIGYATKTKSEVTGAIASVTAEELGTMPTTSIGDVLQGRIAGAFVTQNSGAPGSSSSLYLRGPISLSGGSPLYVVDGVPVDDLDYSFNMEDVKSIDILKDASAAAIYGSKAANGVILVTTKRGGVSKPEISINVNYGVRNVINMPELLQRDEYIKAKALAGYDVIDLFGPESGWSSLPDVDWFDEMYNKGIEQNYTVAMAGGNDVSTYYLSGNYNSIEGTFINNWVKRLTFRVNSDHKITKKLKFSESIYLKHGIENPTSRPGNGYLTYRFIPMMPIYDETNVSGGGWGMGPKGFQGRNNYAHAMTDYSRDKDYSVNISGGLEYEIIDGLVAKGFAGAIIEYLDNYYYRYPYDDGAFSEMEDFSKGMGQKQQYIASFTLNYNKSFGDHNISALLGYEARKSFYGNINYYNRNSFVAEPQSSTLAMGLENLSADYRQTDVLDKLLSQFARFEYGYQGKYLLTANIRRDGYGSKFGPENKYGVFPGISIGWLMSKEGFLTDYSAITLLKLRVGYGVLGNAVGEDFAYTNFYETGRSYDWSTDGTAKRETALATASRLPNPEIQWESVATTNIGADLSLWSNRLTLNLDYYSRQTKKMLYQIPIAPSAGVGESVQANIGQMSNKGFELQAMYRNKLGELTYDVAFNAGFNKNKLISLNPDLDRLYVASGDIGSGESGQGFYGLVSPSRSEPGQPLGQFYGLKTEGIYQTDAEAGSRPMYAGYTPQSGDLIYVDQNNDGVINTEDNKYIGNPWPKMTYGINFGLNWKGIDVKVLFNGVYGNDIYNVFESWDYQFFSDYNTTSKIYDASFFAGNGLTNIPRIGTVDSPDKNKNWGLVSDYHVQSGSYLRLKNLQVGYELPSSVMSKLPFNNLKVFVTANNLFTITGYKGYDPEVPSRDGTILTQGLDFYSQRYPNSRVILLGVNVKF